PRSLARVVRAGRFELRTDTCFETVMHACAESRQGREETWIDERMVAAYAGLHRASLAHSVEAWRDERLVGGLYGVHIGAAFFGESMFSLPERGGTDASKVCLVRLVEFMRARGFALLDTQFTTEHLARFGCVEIPRPDYLRAVSAAIARDAPWPAPGPLVERA
ncbi:MAG: leucyl/phenylalanyl-tRNA--protein transferase, partial [Myxococcota bacterium]